jgi:hypothetical protein
VPILLSDEISGMFGSDGRLSLLQSFFAAWSSSSVVRVVSDFYVLTGFIYLFEV